MDYLRSGLFLAGKVGGRGCGSLAARSRTFLKNYSIIDATPTMPALARTYALPPAGQSASAETGRLLRMLVGTVWSEES